MGLKDRRQDEHVDQHGAQRPVDLFLIIEGCDHGGGA